MLSTESSLKTFTVVYDYDEQRGATRSSLPFKLRSSRQTGLQWNESDATITGADLQ